MSTARRTPSAPDEQLRVPAEAVEAWAQAWAEAVTGTSYVSLSAVEIKALMSDLMVRLDTVLSGQPFAPEEARAVGAILVEAHFTQPLSLSRTLTTLLALPEQLGSASVTFTQRWPQVVAAVAEGYTTALRDHVLSEQQEMLVAALDARELAERALWASERRLEQTKDDFIATVTHELRTPLTPIKGYLHILLARGEAISGEQRADLYQVMLSQAELMQHLLDDLLAAASGIGNTQFSIALQETDVAQVVKRALDGRDPRHPRAFQWLGDDHVGTTICDPARLHQVIANLLQNADLYSTAGRPVHVSAVRHPDTVEIVIRDFGPGIPPELADTVFEPFHRLEVGPTPGTGLGLHIARRLIESMNGRIWLTDAHPGASFHVALPAPRTDAAASDIQT